ncbi:MAG: RNA polymerase sigma factor [Acidobacteriaceae bacterium]
MMTSLVRSQESILPISEADLVKAAQKGDRDAFNQLVLSYQDRIYTLCVRILGDYDLANDIAQNTFLAAYQNLPRFRNGSFRSWLYRIATNSCYDEFRRHKRYTVSSLDDQDTSEENLSPLFDFSAATALPETELERHELALVVQHALDRLDADHRTLLVLVDQLDLGYQQVAEVLSIPVGTVKSRLARARHRMRDILTHSNAFN